ncbi:MAG: amidohydrolase [Microthrixaceae bacterium]|nr:amidohydrolase [Microthrixaceae bacterium]
MSHNPDGPSWLDGFLESHGDELVAFRRRLHAHPEVSWAEIETTAAVIDRLRVAGMAPSQLPDSTGLVCDLGTGASSPFEAPPGDVPVVGLRADLDALAMEDEKDVDYRSTRPGVAHACGHDVHTTVVLGAALALAHAAEAGEVSGAFRFIFEPAEEALPGGALGVIDAGALAGVDSMLGVHCDPKIDVGQVALRTGAITSAADMARITIFGPGGHTARPERTVNLLAVLGEVLTQVPERVAKLAAPAEMSVVFGSTHGGDAPNVIPTRATATATIRTPDADAWEGAAGILEQATRQVVEPSGATLEFAYRKGVPPSVNSVAPTESLRAAAVRVVGERHTVEAQHSRGGDSFAWYAREVPASYARLGTFDPTAGAPRPDIHSGDFDVDERSIEIGVRLLVNAALAERTRLLTPG